MTDYLSLIPSTNRAKPKFTAMVSAEVAPFQKMQSILNDVSILYDIDTAVGAQLDVIGEWVGFSRYISTPLLDVYFAWDSASITGWDSGSWQRQYDPSTGMNSLLDDSYRRFLKAKIASNSWDGTAESAYKIWETLFVDSYIIIQDNQDMSMTVGISGKKLGAVDQALLTGGYLPLKPEGVKIAYYMIPPADGAIFAWDAQTTALSGWDSGQWASQI